MTLEKIKQQEEERDRKIIKIAKSARGKHYLILSKDAPLRTNSGKILTFYNITDYEHGYPRGQKSKDTLSEAKKIFIQDVKDWNNYNTTLGKLKIIK